MIIDVIHGPNLKMLGVREPEIYGDMTLIEMNSIIHKTAEEKGVLLKILQSNHEGKIIDMIEDNREKSDALIINPGAYSHTSIAIMDALIGYGKPVVEVHLTNPLEREEFRHKSYVAMAAEASFVGMGVGSYIKAIEYLVDKYGSVLKSKITHR